MLNFISARWQTLKTKYKKFIPFICTFFFVFISPVSASAYTGDNNNFYPLVWHGNTNIFLRYRDISGNNISSRFEPELVTNQNSYYTQFTESGSGVGTIFLYREESQIDFNFVPNKYDYYFVLTCKSQSDLNFNPTRVRIRSKPEINSESNIYAFLTDIISYTHNDKDTSGFTVIGKIPDVSFTSIYGFDIYQAANTGTFGTDLYFEGLICAFPKGESNAVGSIISAINNQTSVIGGKLDDTNDFINNGNSSTSGIVSQFQSNLNEFNSVISQFDEIENGFISDFTSANDEIKSTLSDYQFTGNLLTCANWVTERYMDFFDNSGDFKQYFIYPLIIGIVLFFIGRGQVILGQAYRKPYESTTVTSSDSSGYKLNKDGSWSPTGYKGSTTTTTYRSGGKLRK